jgi:tRNA 2-thiocytidine biosynthesis protein TtcA
MTDVACSTTVSATGPAEISPSAAPDEAAQLARARREAIKLEKRLCRLAGQAIVDYNMIEAGDRVMVCVSGGKDSFTLLDILQKLQQRAPIDFELVAVNLDQKQPGFPADVLPAYLQSTGLPFHIETQDTYSVVKKIVPEGKTMCSLCSRLRRGILYTVARRLGCNKIALGHHRDDIVATFFLNMFFGAKLKSMPPKLVSDNGEFMVIRPLAYVKEADTARWAEHMQFPIIPCNLCGSQEHLQRKQVGHMLKEWEKQHPGRTEMILQSLQNVVPSHLMDRQLHNFHDLQTTGMPVEDGDKAFDDETFEPPVARIDADSIARVRQ